MNDRAVRFNFTALGDVEEAAPQLGPAKGERDCLVSGAVLAMVL